MFSYRSFIFLLIFVAIGTLACSPGDGAQTLQEDNKSSFVVYESLPFLVREKSNQYPALYRGNWDITRGSYISHVNDKNSYSFLSHVPVQ